MCEELSTYIGETNAQTKVNITLYAGSVFGRHRAKQLHVYGCAKDGLTKIRQPSVRDLRSDVQRCSVGLFICGQSDPTGDRTGPSSLLKGLTDLRGIGEDKNDWRHLLR